MVLAPHGEAAKTLPVVRLATHKLNVSFDTVVGVSKNSTTLAEKHMAAVLTNFVLVRHGKRLFTYITGVNLFSLLCFVPSNLSHPSTTRISL